jgi:hypothetical protein
VADAVQISQNPNLERVNLPLLEAIGGPLIIVNNSRLYTLASLEHLVVVNATGSSAPAIPLPGLQVTTAQHMTCVLCEPSGRVSSLCSPGQAPACHAACHAVCARLALHACQAREERLQAPKARHLLLTSFAHTSGMHARAAARSVQGSRSLLVLSLT